MKHPVKQATPAFLRTQALLIAAAYGRPAARSVVSRETSRAINIRTPPEQLTA